MTPRGARIFATIYLILFALAVTWPGMLPFNRVEPLVLGLPLSMAWVALWVICGCLVLWMVHVVERRGEHHSARRDGRISRRERYSGSRGID